MDSLDLMVLGVLLIVALLAYCSGCKVQPYGDVSGFTYDGEEGGGVRLGLINAPDTSSFSDAAAADNQRLTSSTLALTEAVQNLTAYLQQPDADDAAEGASEGEAQEESTGEQPWTPEQEEALVSARIAQALEALQEEQTRLGRLIAWNMRRSLSDKDPFAILLDRELDRLQEAAGEAEEAADDLADAAEEAEIGVEDLREAREELQQWDLETVFMLFLIGGFFMLCLIGYKVGSARKWGAPK